MNEVLKKLLLVIAVISLFSSFGVLIPAIAGSKDVQDSQIKIYTKLKDVSESDIERVFKEAEIALNSIPPILGVEYKKTIKIKIVDKGICYARGGTVFLPIWHVRNKRASIVHEVTHIIAKRHEGNRFFSEGLAVFFQDKFGEDKGYPIYYKTPDYLSLNDLVIRYRDNLISLTYLKHTNNLFRQIKSENRKIAYIEAGSFISFLYEIYGAQKFKDLYNSRLPVNYERIYGKNINELETEWLNYVFVELPAKEPKAIDAQPIETTKTLIKVQQPDSIYEYGKVKFKVNSGDVLEVVKSKTCRGGFGECWVVRNVSTGETGFVRADLMKSKHKVYTEPVN
jgi:hypothetical protein